MKKIRYLIIDDEPAAIEVIRELSSQLTEDLEFAGSAGNGLEGVKAINRLKPDLVFLDVVMPLLNGVQILEKLREISFETIFTTGSASYALKALKLNAADYLMKPIDPADFLIAIEKVRKLMDLKSLHRTRSSNSSERVQFPSQQGILYVDPMHIVHITGLGSYCQIMVVGGDKITVSKNLGQVTEMLPEDIFVRCHNSHIINLKHVSRFHSKEGFFVTMDDGTSVEVSRRSKDRLLDKLDSITQKGRQH